MKLQKYFAILPLAAATFAVSAETNPESTYNGKGSQFHFSTQVSRTVEKDLMKAEVYSRKSGKSLAELKTQVSTNLNKFLEIAKQHADIDIAANGISNYADYNKDGKVTGWVAEGQITLTSKNFDAMAKVLENLGDHVAISYIDFSVSPEKMASLEDEMTLEIIKQFQHKADVIQQGLNAKKYVLSDVRLNTPSDIAPASGPRMYAVSTMKASSMSSAEQLPLEADKQTISATASGKVIFE